MRRMRMALSVYLMMALGALTWAQESATTKTQEKAYPNPARFEKAILEFEKADQASPPPVGAIVCIGSSSMRGWHGTIKQDLAPLTVIPRGFGGSNMNEALTFADRIVIPYKPRAVMVYEGDNDVAQGIAPEKIRDTFVAFAKHVHEFLPQARIYYLSTKPSIKRWSMWPRMQEANRLIAETCAADKRLTYIDVATAMLGADGQPKPEIFKDDKLHLNAKGYEIWRDVVRPVLMEKEAGFEQPATK